MRSTPPPQLERARIQPRSFPPSEPGDMHGAFYAAKRGLFIISSGTCDPDWEHVSVSMEKRCPNWTEMCIIKDLFWDEEETVVQFHPKKSEYVNNHPHCLHLWKKVKHDYDLPPTIFVGLK